MRSISPLLVVLKLGAVDVIGGNDALEGRADYFHRAGGDHVEVEVVAVHFLGKEAVQRVDVRLQAHALARFVKMLATHFRAELGIVQQQVGKFASLLHQVQLRHASGLALEFGLGNAQQLGQNVARVVEAQGLVKIAGEYVSLLRMYFLYHDFGVGLMVLLV